MDGFVHALDSVECVECRTVTMVRTDVSHEGTDASSAVDGTPHKIRVGSAGEFVERDVGRSGT